MSETCFFVAMGILGTIYLALVAFCLFAGLVALYAGITGNERADKLAAALWNDDWP
jgi:hypothetical protein